MHLFQGKHRALSRLAGPQSRSVPSTARAAASSTNTSWSPLLIDQFTPFLSQLGRTLGVPENEFPSSSTIPPDGPPRFRCAWPQCAPSDTLHAEKPVLVYFPGIDGVGAACEKQHDSIFREFIFVSLAIPTADRTPFADLVELCCQFCEQLAADLPPDRPIYLMGESFGAVLAIAVAAKARQAIDRLILVNPATSYEDSPWPQLKPALAAVPRDVYPLLPFVLMPVIANPLQMAAHKAMEVSSWGEKLWEYRQGLLDLIPMAGILQDIIPQDTLLWKLELLSQGNQYIQPYFSQVQQRTLVLVAEDDRMLPSKSEGKKLERSLIRARSRSFPERSHAIFLEAGVDLVNILKEEGFMVKRRLMSGASGNRLPKRGNNFGSAGPVELPTQREFELGVEASKWLSRLVSPVFFSTAADGTVVRGLSNVPIVPGRPILLVGNHQTVPTDLAFLVEQFFKEKQVLLRGLTHPGAFVNDMQAFTGEASNGAGDRTNNNDKERRGPSSANPFGSFLSTWGAVPVGARAIHDLLQDNECVMLFPGGATEALKGTRLLDRYRLIWSDRPEFVRQAAKFGATIVPFGAIGAEEQVRSIMLPQTMEKLFPPRNPEAARKRKEAMAQLQARKGVNRDTEKLSDALDSRFYVPVGIERYYYVFGKPIETSPEMYRNKAAIAETYATVKQGVEDCIQYALDNRERDPYQRLIPRLLREGTTGGQAPTFEPIHPLETKRPLHAQLLSTTV